MLLQTMQCSSINTEKILLSNYKKIGESTVCGNYSCGTRLNNISFAHLDIAIFAQSFLTKLLHLNEKVKKVKMKFKFSLGLGSVSPSVMCLGSVPCGKINYPQLQVNLPLQFCTQFYFLKLSVFDGT